MTKQTYEIPWAYIASRSETLRPNATNQKACSKHTDSPLSARFMHYFTLSYFYRGSDPDEQVVLVSDFEQAGIEGVMVTRQDLLKRFCYPSRIPKRNERTPITTPMKLGSWLLTPVALEWTRHPMLGSQKLYKHGQCSDVASDSCR